MFKIKWLRKHRRSVDSLEVDDVRRRQEEAEKRLRRLEAESAVLRRRERGLP